MKVKVIKENNSIKIFIDDKEIKNVKSFSFGRENIDSLILNIKVLTSNIEFIDNTKERWNMKEERNKLSDYKRIVSLILFEIDEMILKIKSNKELADDEILENILKLIHIAEWLKKEEL